MASHLNEQFLMLICFGSADYLFKIFTEKTAFDPYTNYKIWENRMYNMANVGQCRLASLVIKRLCI